MNKAKQAIKKAATTFYQSTTHLNHRYLSWQHCYTHFANARKTTNPDVDYLSLQLAFYLASWGMYRGSSFLLQRDYQVHTPVVQEILKKEYDCLFSLDCADFANVEIQQTLEKLNQAVRELYEHIRQDVYKEMGKGKVEKPLSDVLLTKVLLGTLGCTPAYDRFFVEAVKKTQMTTGNYNVASLKKLAEFYQSHRAEFESVRQTMKIGDLAYPQMKFLDMAFWQMGFELSEENKQVKSSK